jgi:aminoglycoside phosphotransferase (APT) family kinase protein
MAPDCLRTTQALFSEAGRHLRAFHEMTGPEGSGRPLVERLEPIEQPLDAVIESTDQMAARMARLCRPRLAPALLDLHVHAKRAFQERVTDRYPRNGVHGDFTPVNVFVDSGKTTLFDFVNFHLGHPYEDLGRFLAYTLFLRKNPLLFRSVDVSALCSAFLDGYGLTDRVSDPELVFFFQRSLFRTIGGGLRFQERSWPLNMVYARAMRRVLDSWISAGGGLP